MTETDYSFGNGFPADSDFLDGDYTAPSDFFAMPAQEDALFDNDEDDDGGSMLADGPYGMPSPSAFKLPLTKYHGVDTRTVEQKIDDLFSQLSYRRVLLLRVLKRCYTPQNCDELFDYISQLEVNAKTVFSPQNICGLLADAGALQRVSPDGVPYAELEQEPDIVEEDGVEYLVPKDPLPVHWLVTDEGRAKVEADDPLLRLSELLDGDPLYRSIYERVLACCAQPGGATTAQLGKLVDDDPLVQKPRFYAAHFMNPLERAGAIEWKGAWVATDAGLEGLQRFFGGQLDAADESGN